MHSIGRPTVNRESIYPFHGVVERRTPALKGRSNNLSDIRSSCLLTVICLIELLSSPDRSSSFLSLPYLMIDGYMATENLPFLNNLYCHRYGQLAYNRVVIFPLTGWDQYFKDLRYPLMNYLTGSLGCKTIALFTQSQEKGSNIKCFF